MSKPSMALWGEGFNLNNYSDSHSISEQSQEYNHILHIPVFENI